MMGFEGLLKLIKVRENSKYTFKTFCNIENAPNFVRIPEIHPNVLGNGLLKLY